MKLPNNYRITHALDQVDGQWHADVFITTGEAIDHYVCYLDAFASEEAAEAAIDTVRDMSRAEHETMNWILC